MPVEEYGDVSYADAWQHASTKKMRDIVSGIFGGAILDSFRVVPRQARSMDTVERMLNAAETLAKRLRHLERLSLELIAEEAHVTPQAAYRYFRNADDVIRLATRRVQIVEHERLLSLLIDHRFATQLELASTTIVFVLNVYQQLLSVPPRARYHFVRNYLSLSCDADWLVSEHVCRTMLDRGDPCAGIQAFQLNAGLTATIATATSLVLRDGSLLTNSRVRRTMINTFLGAIGPSQRPSDLESSDLWPSC
jgi:AcrR family transcriptional regulator